MKCIVISVCRMLLLRQALADQLNIPITFFRQSMACSVTNANMTSRTVRSFLFFFDRSRKLPEHSRAHLHGAWPRGYIGRQLVRAKAAARSGSHLCKSNYSRRNPVRCCKPTNCCSYFPAPSSSFARGGQNSSVNVIPLRTASFWMALSRTHRTAARQCWI